MLAILTCPLANCCFVVSIVLISECVTKWCWIFKKYYIQFFVCLEAVKYKIYLYIVDRVNWIFLYLHSLLCLSITSGGKQIVQLYILSGLLLKNCFWCIFLGLPSVRTCELFLCFAHYFCFLRFYCVDFFVIFLLLHSLVLQVLTQRMSHLIPCCLFLATFSANMINIKLNKIGHFHVPKVLTFKT